MYFLWMLIVGLIIVVPFWKIFQKAGFNSMLAILMIIPVVNLLTVYYLAFTEWPASKPKPPQQP
jgi:hypothetical protein